MRIKRLMVLFIAVVSMAAVIGATAQTADGETPANEGVCDDLVTATPGLYGLCVAYCEAQDLDEFGEPNEPPNERILDNYNRKMNADDPEMPCVQSPCKCWSTAELDEIIASSVAECVIRQDEYGTNISADSGLGGKHLAVVLDGYSSRYQCTFSDDRSEVRILRNFKLTPSEAAACRAQLEDECAGLLPDDPQ